MLVHLESIGFVFSRRNNRNFFSFFSLPAIAARKLGGKQHTHIQKREGKHGELMVNHVIYIPGHDLHSPFQLLALQDGPLNPQQEHLSKHFYPSKSS